jgi:hypothetical protein
MSAEDFEPFCKARYFGSMRDAAACSTANGGRTSLRLQRGTSRVVSPRTGRILADADNAAE